MGASSTQEENQASTTAMLFTIKVQGEIFTLHPYLSAQSYTDSGRPTYKVKYKVYDSHDHSLSLDRVPEILRDFTDFSQLGALVNTNLGELLEVLGVELKPEEEANVLGDIPSH
ncbi:hypothetical protein phytr_1290 [Candidatus Phycorickettsia trachydisci]|uniref:Uncharacterized protein n=1 Tax=Candidatus Phycorickettsia trachydisci TaxID=2115978 RepID=A0A2P1P741_9RICK|nr:hypothetical protein [Candidatus Phycorickettsia trachydisci]AVP87089.1 hypothetical protein phytr_1290 [Candidatus Phycorickettsia trachydisci]